MVYDINGREAEEAAPLVEALGSDLEQYIYCSSAGVYLKSDQMPHREEDAVDPKSRHKVKQASVDSSCRHPSNRRIVKRSIPCISYPANTSVEHVLSKKLSTEPRDVPHSVLCINNLCSALDRRFQLMPHLALL